MEIKQNSLKAWLLATRPKTLTGASIPIMIAASLASHNPYCNYSAVIICLVFAFLMQIAANLINDLFDYLKGTDRNRLGPERACAQGWISPKAMKRGIATVLTLALACGCAILQYTTPWIVLIGALCVLFAFLYTTILSYTGFGDVLVIVFFGLVPCCGTFFAATGEISMPCLLGSIVSGVVIDTLLIINNYRDRDTDKDSGKRTIIVIFGESFGKYLYLYCGLVAWALSLFFLTMGYGWHIMLTTLYLPLHISTWRQMVAINRGRQLNMILGMTSRNMLAFGVLLSLGLLLS